MAKRFQRGFRGIPQTVATEGEDGWFSASATTSKSPEEEAAKIQGKSIPWKSNFCFGPGHDTKLPGMVWVSWEIFLVPVSDEIFPHILPVSNGDGTGFELNLHELPVTPLHSPQCPWELPTVWIRY
jgi:hypothetical protein